MRAIANPQLVTASVVGVRARVWVKDEAGVFTDMTALAGRDWVQSVSWSEDVDATTLTCDVQLARSAHLLSLAPLMAASGLNRGMAPNAPFSPLLQPARRMKVEVALLVQGQQPQPTDWMLVFEGYVDSVDWADDIISVACSDLSAALRDTVIETDRVYAHTTAATTNGLRLWMPNTQFFVGDLVIPNPNRNGSFYRCTGPGLTGPTPPIWPTAPGSTVNSGVAVFERLGDTAEAGVPMEQVLQAMLNDHAPSAAVTLYSPVPSPTTLTKFQQKREMLYGVLVKLAEQIGWMVRFKYRAATGQFELTLFEPDRAKTAPDFTITPDIVLDVSNAAQSLENVRNVCRVGYLDRGAPTPAGTYTRRSYVQVDAASVAKFGRRYMEIAEADDSMIDTFAEAQRLAQAAVSDLATPLLEHTVKMRLFPWAELGDLYIFVANGRHYDEAQTLAVVSIKHTVDTNGATTELGVRGKPAGSYLGWVKRAAQAMAPGAVREDAPFGGELVLSTQPTINGAFMRADQQNGPLRRSPDGFEFHISTDPTFTPSAATLYQRGKAVTASLANLPAGVTHYVRAVPFRLNDDGVELLGAPSPAVSVVPDTVESQLQTNLLSGSWALQSLFSGQHSLLNGSFEEVNQAGTLAKRWTPVSGVWGTNWSIHSTAADVLSGIRCLRVRNATGAAITLRSDRWPVNQMYSHPWLVGLSVRKFSASTPDFTQITARVKLYDVTGALVQTIEMLQVASASPTMAWTQGLNAPAGVTPIFSATSAEMEITCPSSGPSIDVLVDLAHAGPRQPKDGTNGSNGSNGTSGSVWLWGTTIPNPGTGSDGDWYLDTNSWNVYQKVTGVWTFRGNIKGAQGDQGPPGSGGGGGGGTPWAKIDGSWFLNGWHDGSIGAMYSCDSATGAVWLSGSIAGGSLGTDKNDSAGDWLDLAAMTAAVGPTEPFIPQREVNQWAVDMTGRFVMHSFIPASSATGTAVGRVSDPRGDSPDDVSLDGLWFRAL